MPIPIGLGTPIGIRAHFGDPIPIGITQDFILAREEERYGLACLLTITCTGIEHIIIDIPMPADTMAIIIEPMPVDTLDQLIIGLIGTAT